MSHNYELLKLATVAFSGVLILGICDRMLSRARSIVYEAQESAVTTSINGQQTQRLSRSVTSVKIELNTQPAPVSVNVNSE